MLYIQQSTPYPGIMANTPLRAIRIDDEVWRPAKDRAESAGTSMSALIREWTANYAEHGTPVTPRRGRKRRQQRAT